jgi:hypothetical protein
VDLPDPHPVDREQDYAGEPLPGEREDDGGSGDRVRHQRRAPEVAQEVTRHLVPPSAGLSGPRVERAEIHDAPDAGVEQTEESFEVASRAGLNELLGYLPVLARIGRPSRARALRRNLRPGPSGHLAAGGRRLAQRLRDGGERHLEDIVQDERHPFSRGQAVKHDDEGEADLIVEGDPVGWVDRRGRRGWDTGGLDGGRVVRPVALGPR